MKSHLKYNLLDNGVEFKIVERKPYREPDITRTTVIEWNDVKHLKDFPAEAPPGFKETELFWLEPVRIWVAFIRTSEYEIFSEGGIDVNYLGPFPFPYPPPIGVERSRADRGHRLVHMRLRVFVPVVLFARSSLQSVFISYGSPDTRFVETLNDALRRAGVSTFFFPTDAAPGAKLHHVMRDGVNNYDRVILVCSRASLNRSGVLNELEESLQREAREGGRSILIPITIDDYVFSDWAPSRPGVAQAVRDRVVADFRVAESEYGSHNFEESLARLIQALGTQSD